MSDKLDARLNAFTSHGPSPEVQALMTRVRESFQAIAGLLDGAIPASRETSLAFTALEESGFWAMKALSLTDPAGEVVDPPPTPWRETRMPDYAQIAYAAYARALNLEPSLTWDSMPSRYQHAWDAAVRAVLALTLTDPGGVVDSPAEAVPLIDPRQ